MAVELVNAIRFSQELLLDIRKVRKKYFWANVMDFFAMIPLAGIPFGFLRSYFLSQACDAMDIIRFKCGDLSKLDLNVDLKIMEELSAVYRGRMSDFATPHFSAGFYMNDAEQQVKVLQKKIVALLEQLKKQSGLL